MPKTLKVSKEKFDSVLRKLAHSAPLKKSDVEDQTRSQNYEYDAWSHLRKAYTTDLSQPGTWRLA
ncbi:MAG: hypothetical protein ACRD2Y_06875 [Terriglobales bacterium]